MINLLITIISNSDLNSVCFKYFKDDREAVEEIIYGFVRGLDGKISDCMLALNACKLF